MLMHEHIHESNLIEGYDSQLADEQSIDAWNWLMKQPILKMDHKTICELQKRIVKHQGDLKAEWRGKYREIDVWVGGRQGYAPKNIEKAMDYLLSTYTFTNPKTWHVEFEKVHPFVDGNGRTGRMLMWWMEHHRGEKPTLILDEEKRKYYEWFK